MIRENRRRMPVTFKKIPYTIVGTKLDMVEEKRGENNIGNEEIQAFEIRLEAYSHFQDTMNKANQQLITNLTKQLLLESQLHMNLKNRDMEQSNFSYNHRNNSELSNTNISMNNSLNAASGSLFILKIENEKLKYKEKLLQQKLEYHKILKQREVSEQREHSKWLNNQLQLKKRERELLREEVEILEESVAKKRRINEYQNKLKNLNKLQILLEEIQQLHLDTPERHSKLEQIKSLFKLQA